MNTEFKRTGMKKRDSKGMYKYVRRVDVGVEKYRSGKKRLFCFGSRRREVYHSLLTYDGKGNRLTSFTQMLQDKSSYF